MDGLIWSSFFNADKEKFEQSGGMQIDAEHYDELRLIESLGLNIINVERCGTPLEGHVLVEHLEEEIYDACERAVLEFCLNVTDFAKDVLTEEEYEKAISLFARKQTNSKILRTLLARFQFLTGMAKNEIDLRNFFIFRVVELAQELREESVSRSFAPLKKQIEEIAGGVKSECYLSARTYCGTDKLPEECNDYVKSQFGYDFNSNMQDYIPSLLLIGRYKGRIFGMLEMFLLEDEDFWSEHERFNIVHFIGAVYKHNGAINANKILKYIFDCIMKRPFGETVLKSNLPLIFIEPQEYIESAEEWTFTRSFKRFESNFSLNKIENEKLCYPLSVIDNAEVKIAKGKKLAEEFFQSVYGANADKAIEYLNGQLKNPTPLYAGKYYNALDLFDLYVFEFRKPYRDYEIVKAICPDYFSVENEWNRFYIKAYEMFELTGNKEDCFACMFEVHFDIFRILNDKLGFKTSYQLDIGSRERIYGELKNILDGYGIKISENYKSDYITSLLDRKVALIEEIDRFPVLEQLGDAVYGIAIAEMLFYNPDTGDDVASGFESFVSAPAQIEVARKLGIDKLYLSSFTVNDKYDNLKVMIPTRERFEQVRDSESIAEKKKFIADSLEMIIGTICKDLGYRAAIEFTKHIVRETFREKNRAYFPDEVRWTDDLPFGIKRNYWARIRPAIYSDFNAHQKMLWGAFNKFFLAYNLGTEDDFVRRFITISVSEMNLFYDLNGGNKDNVNKVFYCYLQSGLEVAVEKYGKDIKKSFDESFN